MLNEFLSGIVQASIPLAVRALNGANVFGNFKSGLLTLFVLHAIVQSDEYHGRGDGVHSVAESGDHIQPVLPDRGSQLYLLPLSDRAIAA